MNAIAKSGPRRFLSSAFLLTLACIVFSPAALALSIADFALPGQDAQGWTVLTPQADSRIIYVDSVNGNDATAQVYSPTSPAVGADPRQPSGTVLAFRTLAGAYAQMRNGYPDWTLLRAGQVWENESLRLGHGRSGSERQVVTSWGTGARPELRTGTLRGIASYQASNVVLKGIKFWAHTRDPAGPYFTSHAGSVGFEMLNAPVTMPEKPIRDVLFEDCVFRAYANNILTGPLLLAAADGPRQPITRFVMRRCIVAGNYLADADRAQGLYLRANGQPAEAPPSVLLEGNLFDHNGWLIQSINGDDAVSGGQATQYNHNTYFTSPRNVLFYGNIFLRPSSMHNKWATNSGTEQLSSIYIENNLYAEGEIGISAGGNSSGSFRFADMRIADNVFTDIGRSRPTNRGLAYYVGIQDWDGGVVTGNLLINQRDTSITNAYALRVLAEGQMRNVQIENNIVHNFSGGTATSEYALLNFENGSAVSQVTFANNVVQTPSGSRIADLLGPLGGYGFDGLNGYHSAATAGNWFNAGGSLTDLAGWKVATADDGAAIEAPDWDDPDRTLERYITELGLGTTFEDFIEAVSAQSAENWNPLLTAPVINNWFRADVTGAGPAVYGLFLHGAQARAAQRRISPEGRTWLTAPAWYR